MEPGCGAQVFGSREQQDEHDHRRDGGQQDRGESVDGECATIVGDEWQGHGRRGQPSRNSGCEGQDRDDNG